MTPAELVGGCLVVVVFLGWLIVDREDDHAS